MKTITFEFWPGPKRVTRAHFKAQVENIVREEARQAAFQWHLQPCHHLHAAITCRPDEVQAVQDVLFLIYSAQPL